MLGKFSAILPGKFVGRAWVTELWAAAASGFSAPQLKPAFYSCNLPSKFGPGLILCTCSRGSGAALAPAGLPSAYIAACPAGHLRGSGRGCSAPAAGSLAALRRGSRPSGAPSKGGSLKRRPHPTPPGRVRLPRGRELTRQVHPGARRRGPAALGRRRLPSALPSLHSAPRGAPGNKWGGINQAGGGLTLSSS